MYIEGRYAILKALQQIDIDRFYYTARFVPSITYESVTSKIHLNIDLFQYRMTSSILFYFLLRVDS